MESANTRVPLKTALIAGFVLPSLGHFLLGRRGHGVLFAACIYGLFVAGLIISNMTAIDPEHHPIYWWFDQFTVGAPAWILHWGGFLNEPLIGENVSVSGQMYGLAYVSVAGLSNIISLCELARHYEPEEPSEEAATTTSEVSA